MIPAFHLHLNRGGLGKDKDTEDREDPVASTAADPATAGSVKNFANAIRSIASSNTAPSRNRKSLTCRLWAAAATRNGQATAPTLHQKFSRLRAALRRSLLSAA